MQITANGRTFIDAMDLTDDARAEILDELVAEMGRTDLIRRSRGGYPMSIDGFAAAVRCVTRVRAAAEAAGWSADAAERLATTAGVLYADVLAEIAANGRSPK